MATTRRLVARAVAPKYDERSFTYVQTNTQSTRNGRRFPHESIDSKKLNEAAERALDFHFPSNADIKATPRTRSTLFSVDPQATTETLAVHLVETLASVDVMVHQLVDHLEGESRYALLGISNSIMMAEITANRVLDNVGPQG